MKVNCRCALFYILCLLFVLAEAIVLGRTQLKIPSLDNLINKAELIIIAKGEECICKWAKDKSVIYTYCTAKVETCIKGKYSAENITIRTMGGIVDDVGQEVMDVDQGSIDPGKRALLFLKKIPDNDESYYVIYGSHGSIIIWDDELDYPAYPCLETMIKKIKDHLKKKTKVSSSASFPGHR